MKDSLPVASTLPFEQVALNQHFGQMQFANQREKEVFLSYLRGFSLLFLDNSVKKIVEIGGGQSTAIFAKMAERFACKVNVIDMNPAAIKNKIRNDELCDVIYKNVEFLKGVSINCATLESYYESPITSVGGMSFDKVMDAVPEFIDSSLDARKEPAVLSTLQIDHLSASALKGELLKNKMFPRTLLNIFRNKNDEFDFLPTVPQAKGLLAEIVAQGDVDAVFLDSGEFSSLPEWEIVSQKLKPGAYVILHDIFFPKSFKNWLVAASLRANPKWNVLYVDRSTPQGLLVARKESA